MTIKVYQYDGCSTCKKALKFLDTQKIAYQKIAIRVTPPTMTELKRMLKFLNGELKKMFNTSGQDYRQQKIKDQLLKINTEEALGLLAKNGNLIKRPFVIGEQQGTVGFNETEWKRLFL